MGGVNAEVQHLTLRFKRDTKNKIYTAADTFFGDLQQPQLNFKISTVQLARLSPVFCKRIHTMFVRSLDFRH